MAGIDSTALTFTVRRRAPELVVPAKPTPRELKLLSDIDDQKALRSQVPVILVYPNKDPKILKNEKNPASVIREALAKLLVFYYPFASRLKESPAGKLMVDCSGDGVLFIDAEADVMLDQFGEALHPPFPRMEELLYDVPGSDDILDSPLLLNQVTRLLCGGFIFAIRFNHTMCDVGGLAQFLSGLSEIAQGATSPSILPTWQRELLCSSDRPPKTITHHKDLKGTNNIPQVVHKSLFFTPIEISTFRRLVPTHLQQKCSTFEVLTACIWRCHAIAIHPADPEEEMPAAFAINARKMFNQPPGLPVGYYGNVLVIPEVVSTARDLCNKPLGYALELLMKAKSNVTKKHIGSVSDLMAMNGRLEAIRAFVVSDLTRARWDALDLGWGKAAYAGTAKGGLGNFQGFASIYASHTNNKGESGIVIPVSLTNGVMERFIKEINNMLAQGKNVDDHDEKLKSPALPKL